MHLLRNTLLSADHLDKKLFSSTAYPPNNTNLKKIEKAGWLLTKIFDHKYQIIDIVFNMMSGSKGLKPRVLAHRW